MLFIQEIKDGAYVIYLDEYKSIETQWITLYVNDDNLTYSDSFGVEHIPKEINNLLGNKDIKTNIYGIQPNDSVMCGYFCIGFTDFMPKGKRLSDYKNCLLLTNMQRMTKKILEYFQ